MLHAAQMQSVGCTWDTIKQCSSLFIWWVHLKGVFNVGGMWSFERAWWFSRHIMRPIQNKWRNGALGGNWHIQTGVSFNIYSAIITGQRYWQSSVLGFRMTNVERSSSLRDKTSSFTHIYKTKESIKLHATSILLVMNWRIKCSNIESTRALPVESVRCFPF